MAQIKFKSSVAGALHSARQKGPKLEQVNISRRHGRRLKRRFAVDGGKRHGLHSPTG
jgi:hypothetical protein